jgi:hypothetical protein
MHLINPLRLPSNLISIREGYEGVEPEFILRRSQAVAPDHVRLAIAINTVFRELKGGYYRNLYLEKLVLEAVGALGIVVIDKDIFSPDGPVISECLPLINGEDYHLVHKAEGLCGEACCWSFNWGGGGSFYNDCHIMDFSLHIYFVPDLVAQIVAACERESIPLRQLPPALPRAPRKAYGFFSWFR